MPGLDPLLPAHEGLQRLGGLTSGSGHPRPNWWADLMPALGLLPPQRKQQREKGGG